MTEQMAGVARGTVRRLFPGNNTAYGFYSFYDQIIRPDARRVFVIKGGPGVGKSTFMRSIGQELVDRGFDIEHHCCSSDNGSLDGIRIPALEIALIDGTAPHVVDPKSPGAVDEIVHLGDHWQVEGITARKAHILAASREIGRLFRRAYGFLAAAKTFRDQIEAAYSDSGALDAFATARRARALSAELVASSRGLAHDRAGAVRHLFVSANTPAGAVSHLADTAALAPRRYVVNGGPGTGSSELIAHVVSELSLSGIDCEAYHCPLDPQRLEHVYIPALATIVMTNAEPHPVACGPTDIPIDLAAQVDHHKLQRFSEEIVESACHYDDAYTGAIRAIARAKAVHDELEQSYVPFMDFTAIGARRTAILERILAASVLVPE